MKNITDIIGDFAIQNINEINEWFELQHQKYSPCFYNSVDLRNSSAKIAPVDTNVFPAGFNNLLNSEIEIASKNAKNFLNKNHSNANKILLLPEQNDRNLAYVDNVFTLNKILKNSNLEILIGNPDINCTSNVTEISGSQENNKICLMKLIKTNNKIQTYDHWEPDLIISNNDLTGGVLNLLENITQKIIPSTDLGWHLRTKTNHFDIYDNVITSFLSDLNLKIEKARISTIYHNCGEVSFKEKKGIDCVANAVEKTIHLIKMQNEEFGIKENPYVFIKSDKGTYGMGIMTASSGDEVYEINKKTRNKMNIIKQGVTNNQVIIQEGISTINKFNNMPAEPMIYLMNSKPIAGFYRVNNQKNNRSNLNSKGMYFENIRLYDKIKNHSLFFMSCCLVARLSSLAASQE